MYINIYIHVLNFSIYTSKKISEKSALFYINIKYYYFSICTSKKINEKSDTFLYKH